MIGYAVIKDALNLKCMHILVFSTSSLYVAHTFVSSYQVKYCLQGLTAFSGVTMG